MPLEERVPIFRVCWSNIRLLELAGHACQLFTHSAEAVRARRMVVRRSDEKQGCRLEAAQVASLWAPCYFAGCSAVVVIFCLFSFFCTGVPAPTKAE